MESVGQRSAEFGDMLSLVRAEPGDVIGDPLDLVVLSEHPILIEPVIYSILYANGGWDPGLWCSRSVRSKSIYYC
jgi:hypothetical protein